MNRRTHSGLLRALIAVGMLFEVILGQPVAFAQEPGASSTATIAQFDEVLSTCQAASRLGRYQIALSACQESLSLATSLFGPAHPSTATALGWLADLYKDQYQYAQAEPLYQRALAIQEQALGVEHPEVARGLDDLAALHQAQGRYALAESLYRHALSIRVKTLGAAHPAFAASMNHLGSLYLYQGQHARAERFFKLALSVQEKALGAAHPAVAQSLNLLANLYGGQGQFALAEPLYKRALSIREKALGANHLEVAQSLNDLAGLYHDQAQHARAEPLYKRALSVREKALGTGHPVIAASLNSLARLYMDKGQHALAEPFYKRALLIREKALGAEHPVVATSLNSLAGLYRNKGQYALAEPLYKRALSIQEKALGTEHPDVASSLNSLALLYDDQGQYALAEPLYKRALAIREKTFGGEHPAVAGCLNNLAVLYYSQGQYTLAEPLYKRALAIKEKALGAEHPDVASILNNLAELYRAQGQYAQAGPLYKRALAINEKVLGWEHFAVATILNNLAEWYQAQGQYAEAEPLCQRALTIKEKVLGSEHPAVAEELTTLAGLSQDRGQYAQAEPLYKRALAIRETTLRPEHPDIAESLINLAELDLARRQFTDALPRLTRAQQIWESLLNQAPSESRVTALLHQQRGEEESIYGLLLDQGQDAGLQSLALTVSLLRKGRAAEAGAQASRAILDNLATDEQRARFAEWQRLRAERERLVLAGPGSQAQTDHRAQIDKLVIQIEDLEHALAAASPQLRSLRVPRWEQVLPQVASKLPPSSALVEVVLARPYRFQATGTEVRWGNAHYIGMLLFPDQRIEVADLGEAETVDGAAAELLDRLRDASRNPIPAAQALYQKVMAPLQAKLSGSSSLYLSLDGSLNLIPFSALHDGQQYLLDRYHFQYLTSGRDLLRESIVKVSPPPLILADPDYAVALPGVAIGSNRSNDGNTQSLYAKLQGLRRLPATRKEAAAIARLLPGAHVRLGPAATEDALLQAQAPRIVHIATHGLFLEDEPQQARTRSAGTRGFTPMGNVILGASVGRMLGRSVTNPLSRSALALAGAARAERSPDSAHDGVLTAEEVRSLNLWGTELVVLSACETGRGAVQAGQGVYGLRRAFLVAGAQTVVTSLWQVADSETGELMGRYYQKVAKEGKPRAGAMQEAMQELRNTKSHPYYWAPFIVIGRDGPLQTMVHAPE